MMRFKSLGSGSSGNATVVEAGQGATAMRLLIDCGLGPKLLDERLARAGLAVGQLNAIFVTHEHSDHIGCARQLAIRLGLPVWMSHGTFTALGEPDFGGWFRQAQDGVGIDLGALQIMPFTVPHDAREPLQMTCTDGLRTFGVLTDLGHATEHVMTSLSACNALLLECNHDADMLLQSAYPKFLKQRVGGRFGHLSNVDAGNIAKSLNHAGLGHVIAAHLSRQNNRPELAQAALAGALGREFADVGVATQTNGCDWMTV